MSAKKTITWNGRPVVILAIACAVLGTVLYFVHAFQVDRNAASLLREADRLQENGDLRASVGLLQKYVLLKPDDTGALRILGYRLRDVGRADLAYSRLSQVLGREPDDDEVRRDLVRFAVRLRRYDEGRGHVTRVLEDDPDDPEMLLYLAYCREALDRPNEAAEAYREALEHGPDQMEGFVAYARLLRDELEDPEQSARVLDRMVEQNPESARAHLLRGNWHVEALRTAARERGGGRLPAVDAELFAEIEADAMRARELAPEDADVLLFASTVASAEERYEEARALAERCLELHPEEPRAYLSLAELAFRAEDDVGGIGWLERGLETNQRNGSLLVALAEAETRRVRELREENESVDPHVTRVRGLIDRAEDAGAPAATTEYLRAGLAFAQRQWQSASELYEAAWARIGEQTAGLRQPTTLALSTCYERLGRPEQRQRILRRALGHVPNWLQGRLELVAALAGDQQYDEALREIRTVPPTPSVVVQHAQLLVRQRATEARGRLTEPVLKELQTTTGELWRSARGDEDAARVGYELLQAQLDVLGRDYESGEDRLRRLLDEDPQRPAVWAAVANLAVHRQDRSLGERLADVRSLVAEAREEVGDRLELRLVLADAATVADRDAATRFLEQALQGNEALPPSERNRLFRAVAEAFRFVGATAEESRVLRQWARISPQILQPRLRLAEVAARREDEPALDAALSELERIEGVDGPHVSYLKGLKLVSRLASDQKLRADREAFDRMVDQARRLLEAAARQRPSMASVPRTQGLLAALAGNPELADAHFDDAFQLGDRTSITIGRVVGRLVDQGRLDEANRRLREISTETRGPLTGDLDQLAWQVAWERLKDRDDLEQSGSPEDLLLMAQMRYARGARGEEVEKPLRRAVERMLRLRPSQASGAFLALVGYLVRQGRTDEARDEIARAEEELPSEPEHVRPLVVARLYELVGDQAAAERHYGQAFGMAPDNVAVRVALTEHASRQGRLEEALVHLKWFLDAGSGASQKVVDWAVRRKATIQSAQGRTEEALSTLRGARRGDVLVGDLRIEAGILGAARGDRYRSELQAVLERIDSLARLEPEERLQLARLQESEDWELAKENFLRAVRESSESPTSLVATAEAFLRQEDPGGAADYVARLRRRQPEAFRTHALRARVADAQGDREDAVAELLAYLDQADLTFRNLFRDLVHSNNRATANRLLGLSIEAGASDTGDPAAEPSIPTVTVSEDELRARFLPERHRLVAKWLERFDRFELAEDHLRRYAAKSENPRAPLVLAEYLSRRKRFDEALAACEAGWRNEDQTVPTALLTVSILRRVAPPRPEQFAAIRTRLQGAIAEAKNPVPLLRILAEFEDLAGNYDASESAYRAILEIEEGDVLALNNLAWLLALRGRHANEAVVLATKATEQWPAKPELLDTRATALAAAGAFPMAIEDIQNVLAKAPNAGHLYRAAWVFWRAGQIEAAGQFMGRALDAGLTEQDVHPLERSAYRELVRIRR